MGAGCQTEPRPSAVFDPGPRRAAEAQIFSEQEKSPGLLFDWIYVSDAVEALEIVIAGIDFAIEFDGNSGKVRVGCKPDQK